MRQWLQFAARLYPRPWRERYAAEFEALLCGVEPVWSDLWDVLRGAAAMQLKTWSSYLKLAGAVALLGVAVALAASLAAPKAYVSSAFFGAAQGRNGANSPEIADRIRSVWEEVTSRGSLAEVIQHPRLDLYRRERARKPLEDVIEDMRTDLRLDAMPGGGTPVFRISFAYPDRYKAQMVVDRLTQKMLDANPENVGRDLRVVTSASLPEVPLKPDRLAFLGWGLAVGLLGGVLASSLRWRAKWTIKVLACGLAGCIVAGALSLAVPNRYTSKGGVRVAPLPGPDGTHRYLTDAEMAEWLPKKVQELMSDASLAEIIQRPAIDLYRKERGQMTLGSVIEKMRRDIRIRVHSRSLVSISFTYPDRRQSQAVTSALIGHLMDSAFITTEADLMAALAPQVRRTLEECIGKRSDDYLACITSLPIAEYSAPNAAGPRYRRTARELLYLLDPVSFPETPVAPDRRVLAGAGSLLGLFVGAYWQRRRLVGPASLHSAG